jgi:hypothetical protein
VIKRLSVVGLSVFALCGLFGAPAANAAGASACAYAYANVNGQELVNQTVCAP